MAIELIQTHTQPEDFMTAVDVAINEAIRDEENMAITISVLSRTMKDDSMKSLMEYSLSGYDNATFEESITISQMIDFIDYVNFSMANYVSMPDFSVSQIKYVLDNVFDGELIDQADMQARAEKVHRDAQYNGLGVQLRFLITQGRKLEISLIVNAEVHVDTNAQEYEKAKELGIQDTFKPSAADRIDTILVLSAYGMDFL